MSLYQTLQSDLIASQKSKETAKISTLRLVINDIKNAAINAGVDRSNIDDNEVIKSLTKSAKQRKESIELYMTNNRTDLAQLEQDELNIINQYLPQLMSIEDIEKVVAPIVSTSADKNFGLIMKDSMSELRGKADPAAIKEVVERLIKSIN